MSEVETRIDVLNAKQFFLDLVNEMFDDCPEFFKAVMSGYGRLTDSEQENVDAWWVKLQDRGIETDSGLTKYCFICDDLDWVLKFPTRNPNYCEMEYQNYLAAKDTELKTCFAECIYIGRIHNLPLYLMEKMEVSESVVESYSSSCSNSSSCTEDYDSDDGYDVAALDCMLSFWGTKTYNDFWDFCREHYINDIHSANIGFDTIEGPSFLKAIDYSGYNGGFTGKFPEFQINW